MVSEISAEQLPPELPLVLANAKAAALHSCTTAHGRRDKRRELREMSVSVDFRRSNFATSEQCPLAPLIAFAIPA